VETIIFVIFWFLLKQNVLRITYFYAFDIWDLMTLKSWNM